MARGEKGDGRNNQFDRITRGIDDDLKQKRRVGVDPNKRAYPTLKEQEAELRAKLKARKVEKERKEREAAENKEMFIQDCPDFDRSYTKNNPTSRNRKKH